MLFKNPPDACRRGWETPSAVKVGFFSLFRPFPRICRRGRFDIDFVFRPPSINTARRRTKRISIINARFCNNNILYGNSFAT